VSILRILIWNLADSKTSLDEVRGQLPELHDGMWITNEPEERFGLVSTAEALPDLTQLRDLIGKEPEVAEVYDLVEAGV
jgi:hypothetical protein